MNIVNIQIIKAFVLIVNICVVAVYSENVKNEETTDFNKSP